MSSSSITRVTGRAIVLPGQDIDTDRIMPARFLRAVTFDGLEAHVFEDDRRQAAARGQVHPFDDAARRGASVLLAGANFGCGSSREHAPQALARWGIRAIVGESFAEIFAGNSLMIGLPCVSVSPPDATRLRTIAVARPDAEFAIDLEQRAVIADGQTVVVSIPDAARAAFITGDWDATGLLLADEDAVVRTAAGLPYLTAFR